MTLRIGLAIGRGSVRAVALRQTRIVWAAEVPLASSEALQAAITDLLAQAPVSRWSRPVLQAAIGPHGSQVKRVVGLPELEDAEALAAIIREAVGTYFLKNGVPLVTTGVRRAGDDAAVAAALDRPYVDAIRAACLERGYRVGPIAPTAIALTHALAEASFRWNDGSLTIEVSRTEGGSPFDTVRTRPAREDDDVAACSVVPDLARLGADSLRYADAFGAAALDPREPLAVQTEPTTLFRFALPRRAASLLAGILAIGIAIVGLSPLAAKWAGNGARAHVAQVRSGRWQVVSTALSQLDQVSAVLRQARAFGDSRTSLGTLLGELSGVLPAESALLTFEWLGEHGEVTVVTTNPVAVLAALRRLPGIKGVEVVGSVTHQSLGDRDLQRLTIRLVRTP